MLAGLSPAHALATSLPAGFQDVAVLSGSSCTSVAGSSKCLLQPTNIEFAPDGRLFVTEKRGVIKLFDSVSDRTPELVADLRTKVFNHSDSGLLGLAVDPAFPTRPYLYVSYAHDAPPGGAAPTYGKAGQDDDPSCSQESCPTAGRVVKLTLSGSSMVGEQVLVEGSCHPFASHAIDDVQFGPDGELYATTGDGASSSYADYGQDGNACGDPPTAPGTAPSAATSQAGALRAQDARTTADPTGLNGTLMRIDPDTGAGTAGNPFASSGDANQRRIAAFGLRNPFRFAFRPGSGSAPGGAEAYVADVGWNSYEEIDVVQVGDGKAENFGWPCYEGPSRQASYDNLGNALCESLYSENSAKAPFFSYHHNSAMAGGACPDADAGALGGISFYPGGSYPDEYDGALFFADFTRHCLMVMRAGADGRPLPSTLTEFGMVQQAGRPDGPWPVDLEVGPGGDLYYVDVYYGILHKISYTGSGGTDQPPTAAVTASPTSGPVGTTVAFDASGSRDPEGATLTYRWDLDGDGAHDDGTGARVSHTYTRADQVSASVEVRDPAGNTDQAQVTVTIGAGAPAPSIVIASGSQTWHTGETLTFTGSAEDSSGAPLPASALSWSSTLFHCEPAGCHPHPLTGGSGETLSFRAPDHSAPAHLEVRLTATDGEGATGTSSVRLDPDTSALTVASEPRGLQVSLDGETAVTPFTRDVIVGSQHSVTAGDQSSSSGAWTFASWSDGGERTHNVTGARTDTTLTAVFAPADPATPRGVRVAGNDRVLTSIEASQLVFDDHTAPAVVLARSDVFADGLTGTPLATAKGGPLLLTSPAALDPRVAAELERVTAPSATVHVLGGPTAISEDVVAALRERGYGVVRYGGGDRYRTALTVATEGLGEPDDVLLATGTDFADALSAGAAAASRGAAVLLTDGDVLPRVVREHLDQHPSRRWAVGGPAARAVPAATPLVGADRYATSVLVAQTFSSSPPVVGLASGMSFPDALSGGAAVSALDGPLLLTPPDRLATPVREYLSSNRSSVRTVYGFGGTSVLDDAAITAAVDVLRGQ